MEGLARQYVTSGTKAIPSGNRRDFVCDFNNGCSSKEDARMALVLTRKKFERVEIDNDIIVEVVSIKGGKVRLAIHAPASVPIWRSELKESKRKEVKE